MRNISNNILFKFFKLSLIIVTETDRKVMCQWGNHFIWYAGVYSLPPSITQETSHAMIASEEIAGKRRCRSNVFFMKCPDLGF